MKNIVTLSGAPSASKQNCSAGFIIIYIIENESVHIIIIHYYTPFVTAKQLSSENNIFIVLYIVPQPSELVNCF